ncbi:MAG: hypothetical protein HN952_02790 [Candidatus Cloacimonetes bacterium]|jgi:predicted transcriptional regulator|nr:hypothetical protein [Candidatus Cloacimonadota bacterium]MBT7470338.1 hypothetical protein [Candidatus Cloacimonadota bacterium]
MLRKIKALFMQRKMLNIEEISQMLKISESALMGMLQILIQKKFIEKIEFDCKTCSSGCGSCAFANQKDVYKLVR